MQYEKITEKTKKSCFAAREKINKEVPTIRQRIQNKIVRKNRRIFR